jgi:hypothetical protein
MHLHIPRRVTGLALTAGLVATLALSGAASATTVGTTQGCTPGYWKNHTDSWQEYVPTQTVGSVYSGAAPYANEWLVTALNGGGGPGVNGAKTILLRAAVAALLNAAYDPLLYPWQRFGSAFRPPLLATVDAALASGNRDTMLALATWLDKDNNLGCPLS